MASENVLTFTEQNFETEVLNSDQPVLVDFWAEWCAPCRALTPTIEEIAGDYSGKAKVGKINVDDAQSIAIKYGIQSIPSVLVFKGGEVVDTRVGLSPKDTYAASLDAAIG
ncbi:MAG: thioredoxin [Planctomycetota bacterium]